MMYWSGHMTTAGWIVSILWTLFILALLAAAVAWLISALSGRGAGTASEPSAREILDRRLASGELSVEQFKELRETLNGGTSPRIGEGQTQPTSSASG